MKIDYTVGDEIVCILSHTENLYKEGELYTCLAMKIEECNCKDTVINVGFKSEFPIGHSVICSYCNRGEITTDGIWWVAAENFKKLDTFINMDEIKELLSISYVK